MGNEIHENTYPLLSLPEAGTVLYPFRRMTCGSSNLIAKAFLLRLREWMPEGIQVLDDVWVNQSEQMPPVKVEIALLMDGRPDFRIDVEIDVPYTIDLKPVHFVGCGDKYRDAQMSRFGWTVVRFSGSQLLDDAKACADFLLNLDDRSAVNPQPQWTRLEALKLASREIIGTATKSYPEQRIESPSPMEFSEQERQCQPLVKPTPKSLDMQQKMAGFTDSGLYPQDEHIDFEPEEHIYLYQGRERLLPVSNLAGWFFDEFDALRTAENQWKYKGIDIEESLNGWDYCGKQASEVGTFVHAQTESYFKDGTFETHYPFTYQGQQETISLEKEKQQFLHFVEDYHIQPYRQEWPVYDKDLNIAGTIDLICRESDGSFTIYDWKRSRKVVNDLGQPITEAFNQRMSKNGICLPDTIFYHYCVQQNLYRYMLEKHYGIKVKALNLVVLCPEYPTYYVARVPIMDEVIDQIVGACVKDDLGHRLLYE